EVASLGDDRAGRRAKADAEFLGDDLGQSGLAQARGADKKNVIQRRATHLGGFDEHFQIGARISLPDKVGKTGGTQRHIEIVVATSSGRGKCHAISSIPGMRLAAFLSKVATAVHFASVASWATK